MTTNWNIVNLKRNPSTGLVFEVIYSISFELENEKETIFKILNLEGDETDSNFIPFENLTLEIVLDWVQSTLGEEKITDIINTQRISLERKIQDKLTPKSLSGVPW